MQVTLNGEPRRFDHAITVAELVRDLAGGARRIAVERNGEIVPRSRHATTQLTDGDRIEVVVAVGGG
jgi:sulfur carrier protein